MNYINFCVSCGVDIMKDELRCITCSSAQPQAIFYLPKIGKTKMIKKLLFKLFTFVLGALAVAAIIYALGNVHAGMPK